MEHRIYVACLAAYNNGHLHGAWIDATSDAGEMQEKVSEMLASSPIPDAEEWAIHDYEMPVSLSEHTALETIAEIMEYLEDTQNDQAAIAALAECGGKVDRAKELMENYIGSYDSLAQYAEEILDTHEDIPDHIRPYIDTDAYGRDLGYDLNQVEMSGVWHLFHY